MTRLPPNPERGSTLVEVLVAFVILAGAAILSLQVFSDGVHRLGQTASRLEELTEARAVLAEFASQTQPLPPVSRGTTPSGIAWRVEAAPVTDAGGSGIVPIRLQVWAGGGTEGDGPPLLETIAILPPPTP